MQALESKAEMASSSETALTDEIKLLRETEIAKNKALEQARGELDSLKQSLEERERAVAEAEARSATHEEKANALAAELGALRDKATRAESSESTLSAELDALRQAEQAKTSELEKARAELQTLRDTLADREQAITAAEARSKEQEDLVASLKQELNTLQTEADQASKSEESLAAELQQLRETEAAKSADLERGPRRAGFSKDHAGRTGNRFAGGRPPQRRTRSSDARAGATNWTRCASGPSTPPNRKPLWPTNCPRCAKRKRPALPTSKPPAPNWKRCA